MTNHFEAVQVIISTVDSKIDLLPVQTGFCNIYFSLNKLKLEQSAISIVTDHIFINFSKDSWQIIPFNVPTNIITLAIPIELLQTLMVGKIGITNNKETLVILPSPFPFETVQHDLNLILKANGIALQSLKENKCKLVNTLLQSLTENYYNPNTTFGDSSLSLGATSKRLSVQTLMDFIYDNYIHNCPNPQPPNVEELAKRLRISAASLRNEFKKIHGKTLYQAYIDKKMEYAKTLLEQGLKAIEVSRIIGYTSPIKFSKQFQKHFNTTPYQYKKMNYQP